MHGQHQEDRQHMWPGPSRQRPVLATDADCASVKTFCKAGRKVGVGDCALFQAGNAPPFIGIIRKVIGERESDLKLIVNWLYRPGDIKVGKGAPLGVAPNEIFYSFHKDEISAASLLHPCKVAFLQEGAELPFGVSSFVCRRVYDTTNKCLYWLTDQDYTDDRQAEVDELLDRTKREMQAAVQSVSSQKMSQQSKVEGVNAGPLSGQSKGKKRERTDQNMEPNKRERAMKSEDPDSGYSKRDCSMKADELASITDKDGGLANAVSVEHLVQMMLQEQNDVIKKSAEAVPRRTLFANVIAATDKEDCLTRFVQLGGIPILDDWLQEIHKGKVGDSGSPKESDKGSEEFLLTLLRALDKLPVDLDVLKTCIVGKSVNNLRSHRNLEIQKKARKLVETWKKRVDAEMKSSDEQKPGPNPATTWSCKQPPSETHGTKGRSPTERGNSKSTTASKVSTNGSSPGSREHVPHVVMKDSSLKAHASGTSDVAVMVKEEKSCSSSQSQNNSQSWCSGSGKGAGSWKDEVKTSSAVSTGTKTLRSHTSSGKAHLSSSSTAGVYKEPTGGKHRTAGNEKIGSSALLEKGGAESARAENPNNQRIIVRLPNPGRSPARSVSGGSLVDGGAPVSRVSSPGERYDSVDVRSRTPAVRSPDPNGDNKSVNTVGGIEKSGSDLKEEKERSCIASAEDIDCKLSDLEHRSKEAKQTAGDEGLEKRAPGASILRRGLEGHTSETSEGGIDLLASIATFESSENEKSVTAITAGELPPSSDILNQGRTSNEADIKSEDNKDGEKKKKDGLPKVYSKGVSDQGALEPVAAAERVSLVSTPSHGSSNHVQDVSKEWPNCSVTEQSLDARVRDGTVEDTLQVSQDPFPEKDASAHGSRSIETVSRQDGCNGAKFVRGETEHHDIGSTTLTKGSSSIPESQRSTVSLLTEHSNEIVEDGVASSAKPLEKKPLNEAGPKAGDSVSGHHDNEAVAKEAGQQVEDHDNSAAHDIKAGTKPENSAHDNAESARVLEEGDAATGKNSELGRSSNAVADDSKDTKLDKDVSAVVEENTGSAGICHVDEKQEESCREGHDGSSGSVLGVQEIMATPLQSAEAHVPSEEAHEEKGGNSDATGRPVFDLNEGFVTDEVPLHIPDNLNAPQGKVSTLIPTVSVSEASAGQSATPSPLAARVAVVAATRGAFIPPSSPIRSKGELGWKFSAATSAFRPAEPRRPAGTVQISSDTVMAVAMSAAEGNEHVTKRPRVLDIDLNVADEKVLEDVCTSSQPSQSFLGALPSDSVVNNSPVAVRPELDLNRIDESEDAIGLLSSSGADNLVQSSSLTSTRVVRDFDLNDGLDLEEPVVEEPLPNNNIKVLDNLVTPGLRSSSEVTSVASWYSAANPLPTLMMPAFSMGRAEPTYPVVAASSAKPAISVGQGLNPYGGDVYRSGPVLSSSAVSYSTTYSTSIPASPAVSYPTTMPAAFSYPGFPFGSAGFPFTSASFNMGSSPYVSSTNSSVFPTAPSQLVSAGAIMSSYGRPYTMSISEVPGADSGSSWSRPSLDMNAGPDVVDTDAREDGLGSRHMPVLNQLSFQQAGSSGGSLKRKEPEGSFDPFRSGFKQTTWR